jgi:hypothetical protein
MFASASLCYALIIGAPPAVESRFAQVAPVPPEMGKMVRSPDQTRAVVLLQGYHLYSSEEAVTQAVFRDWQKPTALLVKELAKDSDLFSYAYGQNASIDAIVASGGLADGVRQLRRAGYRDIVLVGHSAGALIARQFVEDNPDAGVTKLVQVCPPNGGTKAAALDSFKSQRPFLDSLTIEGRAMCLKERAGKSIPNAVQCVCILSNAAGDSDGLVRCDCQWTPDLQRQGIPVVTIKVAHPTVPRVAKGVAAIAAAVRQDQPRWKPERVLAVKNELFKE